MFVSADGGAYRFLRMTQSLPGQKLLVFRSSPKKASNRAPFLFSTCFRAGGISPVADTEQIFAQLYFSSLGRIPFPPFAILPVYSHFRPLFKWTRGRSSYHETAITAGVRVVYVHIILGGQRVVFRHQG